MDSGFLDPHTRDMARLPRASKSKSVVKLITSSLSYISILRNTARKDRFSQPSG